MEKGSFRKKQVGKEPLSIISNLGKNRKLDLFSFMSAGCWIAFWIADALLFTGRFDMPKTICFCLLQDPVGIGRNEASVVCDSLSLSVLNPFNGLIWQMIYKSAGNIMVHIMQFLRCAQSELLWKQCLWTRAFIGSSNEPHCGRFPSPHHVQFATVIQPH